MTVRSRHFKMSLLILLWTFLLLNNCTIPLEEYLPYSSPFCVSLTLTPGLAVWDMGRTASRASAHHAVSMPMDTCWVDTHHHAHTIATRISHSITAEYHLYCMGSFFGHVNLGDLDMKKKPSIHSSVRLGNVLSDLIHSHYFVPLCSSRAVLAQLNGVHFRVSIYTHWALYKVDLYTSWLMQIFNQPIMWQQQNA